MCVPGKRLKLCTCPPEGEFFYQDHWVLTLNPMVRFRRTPQARMAVIGTMSMPANWESMTSKQLSAHYSRAEASARKSSWGPLGMRASLLERALNKGNCFDFDYQPEPGDQLEFRFLVEGPLGVLQEGLQTGLRFDCIQLQLKKTRWHATGAWISLPVNDLSLEASNGSGLVEWG